MDSNQKPKLVKGIIIKAQSIAEGKYIVFDCSTAVGFITNHLGMRVIVLSDGNNTLKEIIHSISVNYPEQDSKQIESDIIEFISALNHENMLEVR